MSATPSKSDLRKLALAARDAMDEAARTAASEKFAARGLPFEIAAGTIVSGYSPIRSEVDPQPLMLGLAAQGARLALPAVISNGSPRAPSFSLAAVRAAASIASRASSAILRKSPLDGEVDMRPRSVVDGTLKNKHVRKESAKPRSPLKHSIPEFPTKVGGHHVSGSTDPARDSSLKDR